MAAAPKTLNRAVRKQQRKLAHAERLRAKAAAANSEAAAVLVTSATKKNATRAAKRTQAVLTVSKAAPASDTTVAEPLPSPRALGKFRFTGTGLQIDVPVVQLLAMSYPAMKAIDRIPFTAMRCPKLNLHSAHSGG